MMTTEQNEPQSPKIPAMASGSPSRASEHSGGSEVCVPLEALAMPGEDDKLNNPEIGDPVQLMAEGTVSRIEGQMAYVNVKSVNGKPMDSQGAKTTDTPEDTNGDNEFNQLRSDAAGMEGGY